MSKPQTHIRRLEKLLDQMENDGFRLDIVDGNICVVDEHKLNHENSNTDAYWIIDPSKYILKKITNL